MTRRTRFQDPYYHYHVIVRCNNKEFRFETDEDFLCYLKILRLVQNKHRFSVFNYVLMHSHVHLFIQPSPKFFLSKSMQLLNWKFANIYNQAKSRKGHLWLERYTSIPVQTGKYALTLMRYIDRNPVLAGIVNKPEDWNWSGYRYYSLGEKNDIIQPHPNYLGLSNDTKTRQKIYTEFVEKITPEDEQNNLPLSKGPFIGSKIFQSTLKKSHKKPP